MQLTGAGNDVLARLLDGAKHQRVRLGEALEALDELGEILGVLALNGATHDGGDGELHGAERMSVLAVSEGSGLGEELIDTGDEDGVADGDRLDSLLLAGHLDHDALDRLDVKVILLARDVVGAEDADLAAGGDSAGEDAAEGEEASTVRGGDHLGDVHEEGAGLVAGAERDGGKVVHLALVKVLHAVLLGSEGGGKMEDHHLEETVASGEPALHDLLHQSLLAKVLVGRREGSTDLLEELGELLDLVLHGGKDDHADGLDDELHERTLEGLAGGGSLALGPLAGLSVVEVVSPEALGHLGVVATELLGVHAAELREGESPRVKTGGEGNGSLLGRDLDVSHQLIAVGGDDDVDVLNLLDEALVHHLTVELKLEESAVKLVDGDNGLDALGKSLAQHGLGLHRHTLDAVDHDKSTVRDTESRRHLSGEVNVTRRVDQVDEELGRARGVTGLDGILAKLLVDVEVQGDTGGLDGDGTSSLVGARVGETLLTGGVLSDNTRGRNERVSQGRLSVVNVSNHGHVTDVLVVVHDVTELVNGKLHHCCFLMCLWGMGG